MSLSLPAEDLTLLEALASRYPTAELALAEAAALRAGLSLPRPSVHVLSDVHGEDRKLRHVINNASGNLKLLVENLFGGRLVSREMLHLLHLLYYPRQTLQRLAKTLPDRAARQTRARQTLRRQFEIVRALAGAYRSGHVVSLTPPEFRELFEELFDEPCSGRDEAYVGAMVDELVDHGREDDAVRAASHLVRNLAVAEIIVAGDLGDRGPRIDRVIDYLMRQPGLSIVWGNHDASWIGACLGQLACIATVMRFSVRYGRLAQLEEGYGIVTAPLEKLAQTIYADDPAEQFRSKAPSPDPLLMARMQKAMAIIQLKLEGQTIRRHPEWGLEHRNLLHRMDLQEGTVEIDGQKYPLTDRHFPTLDPADPYALSREEGVCMDSLREQFVNSPRLWDQMSFVVKRGSMWSRRDDVLVFHACVPVDQAGQPLPLMVDGQPRSGRALFDALDSVVRRAYRKGAEAVDGDADMLWYLWGGPRSPLFGKDKLTTFEGYFVDDAEAREEHKNPYFEMIHDADFVRRIGGDFGMGQDVLLVNGHVPVRIENGERPVKRGGNAVTIDGAFSEAYGDHGYTLMLAPDRIELAELHHFDSVEKVLDSGADILPTISTIRLYPGPRKIADTEQGAAYLKKIQVLEQLVTAYEEGGILEKPPQTK